MEKAYFAAGCFWGIEAAFRRVPGVAEAVSGYMGGHKEQPTYEEVCTGRTGHAETVEVAFDPQQVSFGQLLDVFWEIHDPTEVNRQGPDVGTQYRSAVFCADEAQRAAAEASRAEQERAGRHGRRIATEIVPAGPFWPAEDYHQRYFEKRGLAAHGRF